MLLPLTQAMGNKDILKDMKKKRGYLLEGHVLLSKSDPKVLEAYDSFYSRVMLNRSSLDQKTKELIVISILSARGLFEPVSIHVKKAMEAGAKYKEIVEALEIVGLYAGSPSMLYGLKALGPAD
jgi:alkylhydroperoxidase/carboxymuconolactone decarboxylase family protein YurZ